MAAGKLENRNRYNGIEHNTDFDLNMYDAFYRNLDPQIGRFWQVDPETESLDQYSTYSNMYNNPISIVDPLGNFGTKFGAWLHRLFNGGGKIEQNEYGEWSVNKTKVETNENGETIVTGYKYYGAGRNKYTAAAQALTRDEEIKIDIWKNGDKSMYQIYDSPQQAGMGAFSIGAGLWLPNAILRTTTIGINAAKTASQGQKIVQSINKTISVQKQARHLLGTAKAGGGFLNSLDDAQKVLDAVHSGEAIFLGTTKAGQPVFRYSGVTGTNVNLGVGINAQSTNLFIIKGTTTPSVVPTSPAWIH